MPNLNYSKWDNLELSDDSDIETHPNVDKRSMIRWKQQDIHQKRIERQQRIQKYKTEIALNATLKPRITTVLNALQQSPPVQALITYSALVHQLRTSPSPDKPDTGAPNQPTYDVMLLHLLEQVWNEAKDKMGGAEDVMTPGKGNEAEIAKNLEERLRFHDGKLDERSVECQRDIEKEEKDAAKKITSDGIHDGFSSGYVNKPTPSILDEPAKPTKKSTKKETTIEVLNSPSSSAAPAASTSSTASDTEDDSDADETIEVSQLSLKFSEVPYGNFEKALSFIQSNPAVLREATTDELLMAAFDAEMAGDKPKAKRCVEKGLLIQYCRKLGKDGVALFFQRMNQGGVKGKEALKVFTTDIDQTYNRMATRVVEMASERASREEQGGEEQIQLVASDDTEISFNIPEGPPPDEIKLEGEGTEEMDPEQVKLYLQKRWDIFESFPKNLKKALQKESLEEVNKVLGKMALDQAEEVVGLMNDAGILSFQDDGAIRDETGKQ